MSEPGTAPAPEGVDALLDRLESVIARLAVHSEPIEEMVVAYEGGLALLAVAQGRLEELAQRSGPPDPAPKPH